MIKELYRDKKGSYYFQKSLSFLYPNLGIKKSSNLTPISTYVAWEGRYTVSDRKLILIYEYQDNVGYKYFEKSVLLANRLFENFYECEAGLIAYVFTFQDSPADWDNFIKGKYSNLSLGLKLKIQNWFGKSSSEWELMESYLYPEKYFAVYAKLLTSGGGREWMEMMSILEEVGQLTDIPNLEKETLRLEIKEVMV